MPVVGETWRYRPHLGVGSFEVVWVTDSHVTLRGFGRSRTKALKLSSLRADYERVQ
jgi:hypothetical protein